jgi:hypothetical protein
VLTILEKVTTWMGAAAALTIVSAAGWALAQEKVPGQDQAPESQQMQKDRDPNTDPPPGPKTWIKGLNGWQPPPLWTKASDRSPPATPAQIECLDGGRATSVTNFVPLVLIQQKGESDEAQDRIGRCVDRGACRASIGC